MQQRTPIRSSTLKSAGYADGVLEISFKDGSVYRYFDVPAEVAEAFLASDSKGHYFVTFILGRDEFAKVEGFGI